MAQFSMEIMRLTGSVLRGNQHQFGKVVLTHRFSDGKARRLSLQAVAIGRHAGLFSTPATFNTEEGARRQRRAAPLAAGDQTMTSVTTSEFWLNARVRPNPPTLLSPEPSFLFTPGTVGGKLQISRASLFHLRIERPLGTSGEGEMVAIVLARRSTKELFGSVGERTFKYTTQWGADPILTGTPGTQPLIGLNQFELAQCPHRHEIVDGLLYPQKTGSPSSPGQKNDAKDAPIEVTYLLLEPHFDVDREEWFVDVPMRSTFSAGPFVRFQLVSYQPHAAPDVLNASEPVTCWAKMLPPRTVQVGSSLEGTNWVLDINLKGPAHLGPVMTRSLTADGWALPVVRAYLYHEVDDPKIGLHRRPVWRPGQYNPENASERFAKGIPITRVADGLHEWAFRMCVDEKRLLDFEDGRFVLYLSEHERFMPATYQDVVSEPVTEADMSKPETLVDSGARSAFRIELQPPSPGGNSRKLS